MDVISQVIEEQREYFKCHRDGDYRVGSPILTSDYPEGLHLNPKGKSGIQPSYLLFRNIDELKQMCVPDQLAVMNNGGDLNWGLKGWKEKSGEYTEQQLSPLERADICHAFQQYIYGDSRLAESYRDILNRLYFQEPMMIPVYSAGKVVVKKGHPLILGDEGTSCTVLDCNELIVEQGAEIIAHGECQVTADKLESESGATFSIGRNGTNAEDETGRAADGSKGNDGGQGRDSKDGCDVKARDADRGANGDNGKNGQNGTSGTNGAGVEYKVKQMIGTHYVFSYGGNGGNGGNGKDGGNGGEGGDAAKPTGHCAKGNPG